MEMETSEVWDKLRAVEVELEQEWWEYEEREFLLQRASYLASRLNNEYKRRNGGNMLLTDNLGIKCVDCRDVFYYNDELVFDGDELKVVDEQYPDWDYARCVECQEKIDGAEAASMGHSDPAAVMSEQGYAFDGKLGAWIKQEEESE